MSSEPKQTPNSVAKSYDSVPQHILGNTGTTSSSKTSTNPYALTDEDKPIIRGINEVEDWSEEPPKYLMYRGKRERPNVGVKDSPEAQGDKDGADKEGDSAGGANEPATDQV